MDLSQYVTAKQLEAEDPTDAIHRVNRVAILLMAGQEMLLLFSVETVCHKRVHPLQPATLSSLTLDADRRKSLDEEELRFQKIMAEFKDKEEESV